LKPHRLFIAILFGLSPAILAAQEVSIGEPQDKPVEERIIYNRESSFHVGLNTQGFGVGYKTGKVRSIYKVTHWYFDLSYLRSLKQLRLVNGSYFGTSSFVFGKLNDAAVLKGGYGVERRIYGKPYWGGVELRWHYGIGASLALLKPYYYMVIIASPTASGEYEQVTQYQTYEDHAQWIDIIGRAPFSYGLNEIKFRPGVYAKSGLVFDIGKTRTSLQAIEVGGDISYFPQGLALMADNPKDYVILTLYVAYNWGARFNQY